MENILTIAIFCLSTLDIMLNYIELNPRGKIRVKRDETEDTVSLLILKAAIAKELRIKIYQFLIRILLMAAWVWFSFYFSKIAILCFVFSLSYSIMIYFTFRKIKELRTIKLEYETAIEILLSIEQVQDNEHE